MNRLGHASIANPETGEVYITGGLNGTVVDFTGALLTVNSDNPNLWTWKNSQIYGLDNKKPRMAHSLTTVQID